jgi:hypothetical protein
VSLIDGNGRAIPDGDVLFGRCPPYRADNSPPDYKEYLHSPRMTSPGCSTGLRLTEMLPVSTAVHTNSYPVIANPLADSACRLRCAQSPVRRHWAIRGLNHRPLLVEGRHPAVMRACPLVVGGVGVGAVVA